MGKNITKALAPKIDKNLLDFFNKTIKPIISRIGTKPEQADHVRKMVERFSLAGVSHYKNMREPATQAARDYIQDLKRQIPPGPYLNKRIKMAVDNYRRTTKPILDAELALKKNTNATIDYIINKEIYGGTNILMFKK